ncbi:MAG TPA: hypothetical protein VLW75_05950 [Rhizomicrobium sp.]|nr:hypothetical protein [Rhizomicrobium sp.]
MIWRTFRCIAEGRDGDWEAVCLDLDIAVQGVSFDEVRGLLDDAIHTYIEDASKEDADTRERLLRRQMPFFARFNYAFRLGWHALVSRHHDNDLHASFEIPCSA